MKGNYKWLIIIVTFIAVTLMNCVVTPQFQPTTASNEKYEIIYNENADKTE